MDTAARWSKPPGSGYRCLRLIDLPGCRTQAAATRELKKMASAFQKIALALGLLTGLSACALGHKSSEEMRQHQPNASRSCALTSPEEAASRIAAGLKRCYASPGKASPQMVSVGSVPLLIPGGSFDPGFIRTEKQGDTLTVALGSGELVHMIVDIRKTETCPAEVVARGWNSLWNYVASSSKRFAQDSNASCKD